MKKLIIIAILIYTLLASSIFLLIRVGNAPPDILAINSIVHYALSYENPSDITNILSTELINEFESMASVQNRRVQALQLALFLVAGAIFICGIVFMLYFNASYLSPFRNLKTFASEIALGNLDVQLKMQKNNPFGAFTESFDIMRQELKRAKDNETKANKAKYELVAKMSHDIRTPIASTLSTIDVMRLKGMESFHENKLDSIVERLNFMQTLATNMFNATLEELAETKTNLQRVDTIKITEMIRQADHQNYIEDFALPGCVVDADIVKLSQVLNNVVSNSYKYAGTKITIASKLADSALEITITDYGPGVKDFEANLIFNKFYRSEDTKEKEGYGLGLYISKHFMQEMRGDISAKVSENGLSIVLTLNLTKS